MNHRRTAADADRETLLKIVSLCQLTEDRGVNPFEVEIREALEAIRPYLSKYKSLEEFLLDAQAVNSLSRVIKLQGDWVKYRSSDLYADPLLLELKLRTVPTEGLVSLFLKAWHPIVDLDLISPGRLKEAIVYWNTLQPFTQREAAYPSPDALESSPLTREELERLGLMTDESFRNALRATWEELKLRTAEENRIDYWEFIQADTFKETVLRAYLTSYLITHGHAKLDVKRLEEKAYLSPSEGTQPSKPHMEAPQSHAITVDYDQWRKLRGTRK
ncbi:MAG: hypothetical protein ACE5PO_02455 [Candidatus Bathyarchaeia archaeon]